MTATFDVELARQLREQGKTYDEIGSIVGVSHSQVAYHLDPKIREAKKARVAANRIPSISGNIVKFPNGVSSIDFMARLAEIPPDTRSKTQRMFGDPVFQRSALAQRAKP